MKAAPRQAELVPVLILPFQEAGDGIVLNACSSSIRGRLGLREVSVHCE